MTNPRILGFNDLEAAYDMPERIGRLAGLIDKLRDDRTIVCGAGDNTALGTVALLTDEGRALARPFFETIQPDAETFGNHDFDFGRQWAVDWAADVPPIYCCANLDGPATDSIPNATILERGGNRIGIIGVTHPKTADICGSIADLEFHNPVETVKQEVQELRQTDADVIVVLSHCGEYDREIATETDVDAVIGGHLHRRQSERINGTVFVRTAGGGAELTEVILGNQPKVLVHDTMDGPLDRQLATTYRKYCDTADVHRPVTEVTDPITRTDADRFKGESQAGNFLADALRYEADTDLAVFPAGSLRAGPPLSGSVTVGEVVSLSPFRGTIQEVEISGAGLRRAFDSAAEPHPGDRGWVHTHLSGGRAQWHADGNLHWITVSGEAVVDEETYSIATTEWLIEASDWFDPISPENVVAEHTDVYEAILNHARAGGLKAAKCNGRIQKLD